LQYSSQLRQSDLIIKQRQTFFRSKTQKTVTSSVDERSLVNQRQKFLFTTYRWFIEMTQYIISFLKLSSRAKPRDLLHQTPITHPILIKHLASTLNRPLPLS